MSAPIDPAAPEAQASLSLDGGEGVREEIADSGSRGPIREEPQAKRDPESLELRAAPRRVVRFRRELLIASAAGLACALAAVAWVALQPIGLRMAEPAPELHAAGSEPSTDALAGLPSSYGESDTKVPELGPPLPGDLGRPILAHQRAVAAEGEPLPQNDVGAPDAAEQAAMAERQRRLAEAAQARAAPVLAQMSRGSASAPEPGGGGRSLEPGARVGAEAGRESATTEGTNPERLRPPASRWQLSAGTMIAASLVTGLNSDIPGMVVAQVTEPAYDSATGRAVLVPQGARLLGRYEDKVRFGQRRALVLWERLIMPDGSSIALGDAPAIDAAGFSGLSDEVDFHSGSLLRGIGLSSLLGVGTELTFGESEAELVRALRESLQTNADRAAQRLVERNLDIAPTIKVRPGFPVRVLVHRDLVLPPWREPEQ